MTEPLLYHNREMKSEPSNYTLEQVAGLLHHYTSSVIAILEPGDATRYILLIVPAWSNHVQNHLNSFGIPDRAVRDYLIAVNLDDRGGRAFYATGWVGPWDLIDSITNEWSRELLAWWFQCLWEEIERCRNS